MIRDVCTMMLASDKSNDNDSREDAIMRKAAGRFNRSIMMKFRTKENPASSPFAVCNYHVPCMISLPAVITLHAALYAQEAQKFASGSPLILTGDFNLTPTRLAYQLLTTGEADKDHEEYPTLPKVDRWTPTALVPLRSAYKELCGEEPESTNKAVRFLFGETSAFSGTLDYLFYSGEGIRPIECLPIPADKISERKSLPSRDLPSDHVMVGAEFGLF